jgi:glycosyltransferase involved in cell wall biosynthesis
MEGILVQDGDPWAMAGAIIEIIKDKKLLTAISENARNRALHRHNISNVIKNYKCIYSEVIENTKTNLSI